MTRKTPAKYHERKVIIDHDRDRRLRGYGHSPLVKQRGLKGTKLGPANSGRSLSKAEIEAIEDQLRSSGVLK